MLIYRRTSLLDSTAQTVVNTVNCVGVMGKGIALAFKEREPEMFKAYKEICDRKLLEPGKLWLWRGSTPWVLNFPTKVHWRNPSRLEWIELGLQKFVAAYEEQGIREISFPRLGCGNGGLDWQLVRPLMERYLSKLPIEVYIHDFEKDIGLPEHMESVAKVFESETFQDGSFESFLHTLRRILDVAGNQMVELGTERPFVAHLTDGDDLAIEAANASWTLERDDLRGAWIGLLKGLLTKDQAGWSFADGGEPVLSILSVLPDVKAVEIQRAGDGRPELALELRPARFTAAVPPNSPQREFAWR